MHGPYWPFLVLIKQDIFVCRLEEGDPGRLLAGPVSGTTPVNFPSSEKHIPHIWSAALDISVSGFKIAFPFTPWSISQDKFRQLHYLYHWTENIKHLKTSQEMWPLFKHIASSPGCSGAEVRKIIRDSLRYFKVKFRPSNLIGGDGRMYESLTALCKWMSSVPLAM